jgi:hypothetical protein
MVWPMYVRGKVSKRIYILAEPAGSEDTAAWYYTIDQFGYHYKVIFAKSCLLVDKIITEVL